MGSQQLLILIVVIVVVLLMIYVGTLLYNDYVMTNNRDQLILTINHLSDMANQHIKKPVEAGGGNGKYLGWIIPPELDTTDAGTFTAIVRDTRVNIEAVGYEKGNDGVRNVIVKAVIRSTGTTINIDN